jgi:hypothetical protein
MFTVSPGWQADDAFYSVLQLGVNSICLQCVLAGSQMLNEETFYGRTLLATQVSHYIQCT